MKRRKTYIFLILALALSLNLGGCGKKWDQITGTTVQPKAVCPLKGEEKVDVSERGENPIYVSGPFPFEKKISPVARIETSPNGLYVWEEITNRAYEFDSEGKLLRETEYAQLPHPELVGPDGTVWALTHTEIRDGSGTIWRVSRVENGEESEIVCFETGKEEIRLFAGEDGFLLCRNGWDKNGNVFFTLERYDRDAVLKYSAKQEEAMTAFRTENGLLLLGRESADLFCYNTKSDALTKPDHIDRDCRICAVHGDTLYLTDRDRLYRQILGSGEKKALFRYADLSLPGQNAPVRIGGTENFLFVDYRRETDPYLAASVKP